MILSDIFPHLVFMPYSRGHLRGKWNGVGEMGSNSGEQAEEAVLFTAPTPAVETLVFGSAIDPTTYARQLGRDGSHRVYDHLTGKSILWTRNRSLSAQDLLSTRLVGLGRLAPPLPRGQSVKLKFHVSVIVPRE
jgi:hypothetical protein